MKNENFHILALSGGGFRGLYSATVLAEIEERWGAPLASRFDLICGTSIGGILALAIAMEMPVSKVCNVFKDRRHDIFPNKRFKKLRSFFSARYSNRGLRQVLQELFGDQRIGDLRHRIMIPSINFTKGSGQFFKTQHHPTFQMDGNRKLVDVALATSAAPIYFPMHKSSDGLFIDGGLIGNAPGFFGLHEAIKFLGVEKDAVKVLSVGTLSKKLTARINEDVDAGLLAWNVRVLLLAISAQESSSDFLLKHYLGNNYCQIDSELTEEQARGLELDTVTDEAVLLLEQRGKISIQEFFGTEAAITFGAHSAGPTDFFENGKLRSF